MDWLLGIFSFFFILVFVFIIFFSCTGSGLTKRKPLIDLLIVFVYLFICLLVCLFFVFFLHWLKFCQDTLEIIRQNIWENQNMFSAAAAALIISHPLIPLCLCQLSTASLLVRIIYSPIKLISVLLFFSMS